jgi:PAS domain S-box-containing protein
MDDLAAARQQYLEGNPAPEGVRPVVQASWERCRAYGVDPHHMRPQAPDPARLQTARGREQLLLESAGPFLQLAHEALANQPHLLALSDRHGLILRILTGPGLPEEEFEASNLLEGASWHERDTGCNGVGTCLATGESVILIGPEHFQESYVGWTCIGVPIQSGGEIVGALDLSVPNDHAHVHTWGWVLSLAKGIQASLARETSGGQIRMERVVMDLETPFHGVRGVFDLLVSQIELPPTHTAFLEAARSKLAQAEALVQSTIARLHESEERLRRIAESGMVGLLFWEIGGRISHANDRFLKMVGYSQADLEAGRVDWRAMTPPEWEAVDRAAIEQLCTVGASTPFEKEFIRKDGSRIPVLLSAATFSDTTERGVTLVLDISERKRAEQERERLLAAEREARSAAEMAREEAERSAAALAERESEFRAMADNIPQLAWMADASGWIYWYNRRWYEYTGTTLEQMQGWGWRAVHHPDHVEPVVERIQRSWDTGERWEDTFPLRSRDGEWRWFLSRAEPIRDKDGRVIRWFGTNTDITEQRAAETERERLLQAEHAARAEAEAANRAKMDFLSAMSHELRTPLNAIGGYVELLGMGIHGPVTEAQQTALSRITSNQRHLLTLINDILAFARLEAGQVEFDLRPLSAYELLLSVEPLVAPTAAAKGIAYSVQERDGGLVLFGDEERVRQIVLNLVSNAIKFSQEGAWVLLSYDADAEFVSIHVRDNGPGIPHHRHQAIFDPFVQVNRRLNRPHDGIGLGLAISRDLARAMGGELSVESTLGEGSTFTLRLPRVQD